MQMEKRDYLKKALLDTQERIRDFMSYSVQVDDARLQGFFRHYAESEGRQAQQLQAFIDDIQQS